MTDIEIKPPVLQKQETEVTITAPVFSEEDEKEITELASLIDFNDSTSVLEYGVDFMQTFGKFSNEALKKHRSKDLGDIEKELLEFSTSLVVNEEEDLSKNIIIRLFQKGKQKGKESATKVALSQISIEKLLNQASEKFLDKKEWLLSSISGIDTFYEYNLQYHNMIEKYTEAAKRELEKGRRELPTMVENAKISGDQMEVQRVRDFAERMNDLEQKVINFNSLKVLSETLSYELRIEQKAFKDVAGGINEIITTSIPHWKLYLQMQLVAEEGKEAARILKGAQELTQTLAKKNADTIHDLYIDAVDMKGKPTFEHETVEYVIERLQDAIQYEIEKTRIRLADLREGESRLETKYEEFQNVLINYSDEMGKTTIDSALDGEKKYKLPTKKV